MHRCITLAMVGAALGFAALAHGQPVSEPSGGSYLGGELAIALEFLRVGGLPGILAYLAFQFGRMIDNIALTVRLHEDDRRLLETHCRRED